MEKEAYQVTAFARGNNYGDFRSSYFGVFVRKILYTPTVSILEVVYMAKEKTRKEQSSSVSQKPSVSKKPIGKITHFYDKIGVAVVALDAGLKVGDKIKIGKNDKFVEQEVKSMQVEHEKIEKAKKGQEVGLKVKKGVKNGDLVFKA